MSPPPARRPYGPVAGALAGPAWGARARWRSLATAGHPPPDGRSKYRSRVSALNMTLGSPMQFHMPRIGHPDVHSRPRRMCTPTADMYGGVRRRLAGAPGLALHRPRGDLCARGEAELAEDVGDVPGRGGRGEHQLVGDAAVGQPPGDQRGDLELARGQRGLGAGTGRLQRNPDLG